MRQYQEALEAAGAEILAFDRFGSYQGDWWAKVVYEGRIAWAHGYYGSCSGCDAFEAEFGFVSHDCVVDKYYDPLWGDEGFKDDCKKCQEIKRKFKEFGKKYLSDLYTQEEAEGEAERHIKWDSDAEDMLKFIQDNAIKE